MKILLENIKDNPGFRELYRIVSQGSVEYINNIKEYEEGLLLHSRLFLLDNIECAETSLIDRGKVLNRSVEKIEDIEVYIDNIKKKRDVALKKTILKASYYEGKIPWGILTGIRPTKVVHRLLDKKIGLEEIKEVLNKEYLIREDKISRLVDIALRQRDYLEASQGKYSIYIGIPFCPSRCLYCSFPSLNIDNYGAVIDSYIETVIYELRATKDLMGKRKLNTVYIGGGTPTSLKIEDLRKIIRAVREIFMDIEEFTVEAGRPDTLNYEYLKMLRDEKIDRISINPQTMNDSTLKIIGRNHTGKDIVEIYKMTKDLGIEHINMDLILGLPSEKYEDVLNTLREIEKLGPNNLTVHSLALKTGSRFSKTMENYQVINNSEAEEISQLVGFYMDKMNLKPYYLYRQKHIVGNLENIGYSLDGDFCKYNISMMEERETVIGIGLGSVTKIVYGDQSLKRIPNFKGLEDYLSRIDEVLEKRKKYLNKSLESL